MSDDTPRPIGNTAALVLATAAFMAGPAQVPMRFELVLASRINRGPREYCREASWRT